MRIWNQWFMNMLIILPIICFLSCASKPKVEELPIGSDPQVEIEKIDMNLHQARENQVDTLSPTNFKKATEARDEAVEYRSKNKDQEDVLYKIALAQAYLDKAHEIADVGEELLTKAVQARNDALKARADEHHKSEMDDLDEKLSTIAKQIENDNIANAERYREELEKGYRDLEISSIKKNAIGEAKRILEQAKKEGASELTPDTLSWAEKKISDSEKTIENNRHDSEVISIASREAKSSADRLLQLVRTAKGSTVMDPEDYALQLEEKEQALSQTEEELNRSTTRLSRASEILSEVSSRTGDLERLEAASSKFSEQEAEVYRHGKNVLIRLKGLSFPINSATIPSSDFTLMAKVQEVINDTSPETLIIEGHTDSVGSKKLNDRLSLERAKAVKAYLVANKVLPEDKINIKGLGFSKPLASNKSKQGRAENRRVDIVITPRESASELR